MLNVITAGLENYATFARLFGLQKKIKVFLIRTNVLID